jgi:Tol biopolymer transport system component/predicted Ser/Thr protein kinase
MALTPGARLGQYEISEVLGVGGMGEVYRARDAKLSRTVAVKVLLPEVASNPDRLLRFEREARALAALNHQNVAQIYGLDEARGTAFLVMELVEGPTLAERIARGPLPLDEALELATQIARALEAAHEQGIIHRDLKPANVKVRVDGVVKVLDFGLAKVLEPVPGRNVVESATVTSPAMMTHAGVILGTAAYMSPEQARGQATDSRTDIWAFGCVLYEMLTGRPAFSGPTMTDVLAAIIEREPDWSRLAEPVPIAVRRLLLRCLAKDPGKRLRHLADARLELDDARSEPAQLRPVAAASRSRRTWMWSAALLVVTALLAAWAAWVLAPRTSNVATAGPPPGARIERLTFDSGITRMPAISPDGRLLAYASDRSGKGDLDIWVQQMSGGTPLRLTDDPADDATPDFSPDGSQIVFRSERGGGGVYVMPALGGGARLIAADGRGPRFSPDGSRIAYWTGQFRGTTVVGRQAKVFVVALSGGAPARLLPDFDVAGEFVWTGDGRALIMAGRPERGAQAAETFDWWLAPLDGTSAVKTGVLDFPVLQGEAVSPGRWTSDGVLFSFKDDLWNVPISNAGRVGGEPQRLTLGVGPYVDPAGGPNGDIVFARMVTERAVERASLTNVTEPVARLHSDGEPSTRRASETADGSRIVFERGAGGSREIWLKETTTGHQEMVTRVATEAPLSATVSPDGARLGYTEGANAARRGAGTGYVIETSGGVPRKVCDSCTIYGFLADNQRLLISADDSQAIQVMDVRTHEVHQLAVSSAGGSLDRPHASPDDRWLAFRRQREGIGRTFVVRLARERPADADKDKLEAVDEPTTTGRPAGWSLDSRVLYLLLDTDGFRCIWGQRINPQTGALVGKPFAVRHFHRTVGMSTSFANPVTTGGFIYEAADVTSNLWKLTTPRAR